MIGFCMICSISLVACTPSWISSTRFVSGGLPSRSMYLPGETSCQQADYRDEMPADI